MLPDRLFDLQLINQDGAPDDGTRLLHITAGPYDCVWTGRSISRCSWADYILSRDHTLPLDYYNTKKLIKNLGLPMEKIDACRNGYMLYWKDDIDVDYCKFCREARYKPTRERNPNCKKTLYAILSYLVLTPRLQRLYALEATAE
ncbi:hypothetical protein Sango_2812000 [Sesamum angolense]|uniref:Uncharacterized protein n=1 Tax=Sesamum angolense TaxID=2727404 RepID=A0AAE1T7K4_9LAMI|nr:hypothetical protein Sango_2812000 [Sesamum angolense]